MTHVFEIEVAQQVGVNAAVIYQYLWYWCEKNRANGLHLHDGRYWTHCTLKAFGGLFPYLSEMQIRTAINKLIEVGLVVKDSYGKTNRTSWYSANKHNLSKITNAIDENNKCNCYEQQMPPYNTIKEQTIQRVSNAHTHAQGGDVVVGGKTTPTTAPPTPATPTISTPANVERSGEGCARAMAKFRQEVAESEHKRTLIMKSNAIYDFATYDRIANAILDEWEASDIPTHEINWRHFTALFRIRVEQQKRISKKSNVSIVTQPNLSPSILRKRNALKAKYNSVEEFLVNANPDVQLRAFKRTASMPTLKTVDVAYGDGSAQAWLMPRLAVLANYAGTRNKMTQVQMEMLAGDIACNWSYLDLGEIDDFLWRFRTGEFGHYYGVDDPQQLMHAFREYLRKRSHEVDKERSAAASRERDAWWGKGITYEQYATEAGISDPDPTKTELKRV